MPQTNLLRHREPLTQQTAYQKQQIKMEMFSAKYISNNLYTT